MKRVKKQDCRNCNGSGEVPAQSETCSSCGGKGYKEGLFGDSVCSRCDGTGKIPYVKKCPDCGGNGYIKYVTDDSSDDSESGGWSSSIGDSYKSGSGTERDRHPWQGYDD